MDALLLGSNSTELLADLKKELNERTRKLCEELDHCSYETYSPWMSVRPLLQSPVQRSLLAFKYSGGLVTDKRHLQEIDSFLQGVGSVIVSGLPVRYSDWPVMVDVESARPDAISCFDEGKALLCASSCLESQYPVLVDAVIPQDRERPSGFDSGLARGLVFRTFPKGRSSLLAGFQLAHAMGHQAAILLQSVDPLIEPSDRFNLMHYEVRNDKRSADHALVSAVALGYMAELAKELYPDRPAPWISDEHVRGYGATVPKAVQAAVRSIKKATRLTEMGHRVVSELEAHCAD
jgi:hypothetical protein